ncbi:MAG TPA: acyl-CoA carboxylase subunit epsilon [Nocardioidaceae bacterium]|nr:acyl-CoA carboxylase subunit epsilon [Nocardioidaceae bacterium]
MTSTDTTPVELPPPAPPMLRVVSGDPSDEELAAVVAVVATAVSSPGPEGRSGATPAPRSAWRDRERLLRRPHAAGPGAWRASSWTR